jgi:hypothetical protein
MKTPDVSVDLLCNNDGTLTAKVAPWRAETSAPDGKFSWKLRNAVNVDEMDIGESGTKAWPFPAGKKFKVKKNQKVDGQPDPGKTGDFHYAITATCTIPSGPSFQIVIDPDMIIPPSRRSVE